MNGFLPESLAGWLSLVVQFVVASSAAIVFALRFVRKPLEDERARDREKVADSFKTHGERIGEVEGLCKAGAAQLNALDRTSERLHLQMISLSEHHGRLEERLGQMTTTLQLYHDQRVQEDRQIGERLARIESKMDIPHRRD